MAINGIEAGAALESSLLGTASVQASNPQSAGAFQESPNHARDSGPQIIKGATWDFLFFNDGSTSGGANGWMEYEDPQFRSFSWHDGQHIFLSNVNQDYYGNPVNVGTYSALGKGYVAQTYAQFYAGNDMPPQIQNPNNLAGWLAPLGSDTSFTFRLNAIFGPGGVYQCGFGFNMANSMVAEPFVLPGSARCQLVSADFTQIIDVTPANSSTTDKTRQSIVIFQVDTVALFGRKTSFYPQVSQSSIGSFSVDPKYAGSHSSVIYFGPHFCSPPNSQ